VKYSKKCNRSKGKKLWQAICNSNCKWKVFWDEQKSHNVNLCSHVQWLYANLSKQTFDQNVAVILISVLWYISGITSHLQLLDFSGQFHQHLRANFLYERCFSSLHVSRKSCRNDVCLKNLYVNCWWNWLQFKV